MKFYDLNIIAADKTITFSVQEPETDREARIGLSYLDKLPENQGMIYFSIHPEYDEDIKRCTKNTKFPVDFLFVDEIGNITKIDKNVPALSNKVHKDIFSTSVIELNAGTCDKFDICEGDSVIHPEFAILPDNKIEFHGATFDKIVQRTFKKVHKKNIAFFAIAEGGAMGWAGAIQIITKEPKRTKFFFIDETGIFDFTEVEKIFPTLKKSVFSCFGTKTTDKNWSIIDMGMGNYLFVKNDYIDQFKEKTKDFGRGQIYQNWVKIATDILK